MSNENNPSISESCVAQLARFFPDATPVRIPVKVTGVDLGGSAYAEQTVIEFGTPREVLFASRLPLEFSAEVKVENADGSLQADAAVVALHLREGRIAVAARFAADVSNWIVKPGL